jgi:hypothetical protein
MTYDITARPGMVQNRHDRDAFLSGLGQAFTALSTDEEQDRVDVLGRERYVGILAIARPAVPALSLSSCSTVLLRDAGLLCLNWRGANPSPRCVRGDKCRTIW